MLMDLVTLDWDDELLGFFTVPRPMLPEIVPSSAPEPYGLTAHDGPFGANLPITGALGDQHAATVGQVCLDPGEAKNTYGTGNFLLLNTGTEIVRSGAGLLTTVCLQVRCGAGCLRARGVDRGDRFGRAVAALTSLA